MWRLRKTVVAPNAQPTSIIDPGTSAVFVICWQRRQSCDGENMNLYL
jgi:hypothetical protein